MVFVFAQGQGGRKMLDVILMHVLDVLICIYIVYVLLLQARTAIALLF